MSSDRYKIKKRIQHILQYKINIHFLGSSHFGNRLSVSARRSDGLRGRLPRQGHWRLRYDWRKCQAKTNVWKWNEIPWLGFFAVFMRNIKLRERLHEFEWTQTLIKPFLIRKKTTIVLLFWLLQSFQTEYVVKFICSSKYAVLIHFLHVIIKLDLRVKN